MASTKILNAKKWEKEQSNALFKSIAFIKKSFQKIIER